MILLEKLNDILIVPWIKWRLISLALLILPTLLIFVTNLFELPQALSLSFLSITTIFAYILFLASKNNSSPINLNKNSPSIFVYYPHYDLSNSKQLVKEFSQNKLTLDPASSTSIGGKINWNETQERSGYFMFNLHTLRFLAPLIHFGAEHDFVHIKEAMNILFDWNKKNSYTESPHYFECFWGNNAVTTNNNSTKPSCYAWGDEHAVAWRSIVISYLWNTLSNNDSSTAQDKKKTEAIAREHAKFLFKSSMYRYEHNHGLNFALASIALATAFKHLAFSKSLFSLGINRAIQQMKDNVSNDGVHLEHSGFYHWYTLRSFIEIARVAEIFSVQLPNSFQKKLSKMRKAGLAMSDKTGIIDGLPYSNPDINFPKDYLIDSNIVKQRKNRDSKSQYKFAEKNTFSTQLQLFDQGGFCFFPETKRSFSKISFHTRILYASHWQQDALGITIKYKHEPLVVMPSTLFSSYDNAWEKYFHSTAAHNTITIEHDQQTPPIGERRPGIINKFLDSYKLQSLVYRTGQEDIFSSFRAVTKTDRIPLNDRLNDSGGKIIYSKTHALYDCVIASHETFSKSKHRRIVARFKNSHIFIIDFVYPQHKSTTFYQLFHLPINSKALSTPKSLICIHLASGKQHIARQLSTDSNIELISGALEPQKIGWYLDNRSGPPSPTPTIRCQSKASGIPLMFVIELDSKEDKYSYTTSKKNKGTHIGAYSKDKPLFDIVFTDSFFTLSESNI